MDEKAVADYEKTCVSTFLVIQDLLDKGELGDDVNNALADYHMTLTRKCLSLSRKTRAFHQQQAAQEAECIACEKYAEMGEEDFFTLYESKLEGHFPPFQLAIIEAEYKTRLHQRKQRRADEQAEHFDMFATGPSQEEQKTRRITK